MRNFEKNPRGMLLLIAKYLLDCPPIDKCDAEDILDNLFDIKLGLIEDRYLHRTEKEPATPVYFFTLKSITNIPNRFYDSSQLPFDIEHSYKIHPKWLHKIENGELEQENNSKDHDKAGRVFENKSLIKESRLLQKGDFLISFRGEPTGFSLLNFTELDLYRMVPSNSFIRLRPRHPNKFDLNYLHLILEIFTNYSLVNDFRKFLESNQEIKNRSYTAFNSVKIEDLRGRKLRFHSNIEQQKQIFNLYKEQYQKWMNQFLTFNQFELNINSAITING